jgi:hypothetical protein
MINFRYHVVSLTAVFLALAIGLVVGTAALNGPASDALHDRVNALSQQNQQYRAQVSQLQDEADNQEQFAEAAAPYILASKLSGRRVLIVSQPSANSNVRGVQDMLTLAGAKVTGQVEIEDKFTDPNNSQQLLDLADATLNSLPTALTNVPLNSNGVETATFLLASVLVDHTPAIPHATIRSVLKAFSQDNFIVTNGDPTGPAEAVVFVAGSPYTDSQSADKNTAVLTLATQLDTVSPLVVAANGTAGSGNVIKAIRTDPTLSKTISTVDNVATPQGRVTTVLALIQQVLLDRAGQYGSGSGSQLLPKPSP